MYGVDSRWVVEAPIWGMDGGDAGKGWGALGGLAGRGKAGIGEFRVGWSLHAVVSPGSLLAGGTFVRDLEWRSYFQEAWASVSLGRQLGFR